MASGKELLALAVFVAVVFVWSLIGPYDGVTWVMEAMPVMIAAPIIIFTYGQFPLTRLTYYLIAFHAVILLVGAHFTYARVPVGDWVANLLELDRNHYDRFAHVVQGFVPAIIARELLIRLRVVNGKGWLFMLVCSFCLAVSALYEIIEWQSTVWGGDGSLDFLGVQGDVWDAQWDMTLALFGAVVAQLTLARYHNRQIETVQR